ncbi:threonine/serine ThrE exporter family protein [Microbacterium trichothecenolyticum]
MATSTTTLPTLALAVGVLIAAGILLWLLIRREPPQSALASGAASIGDDKAPAVLDAMAALGIAMIDSGYPVGLVRSALDDMAKVNGLTSAEAVVFPTSVLVSSGDAGSAQTRAVTAGDTAAMLHQVDAVDRIAGVARTRPGSADWVRRQLTRVQGLPAPFTGPQRVAAYGLLSAALSVLLGSSWPGVVAAGALGIGVGALLLGTERLEAAYHALVVVTASFGVGVIMLTVAHLIDPAVLPAIVAPLIMLLPGGLLTIGVIELATGHIVSGAARLAAGAIRLLLLATGIVAAVALIGVPAITATQWPLGPIAPWVAVAVFGLGISIHQCARPSSIGWILIVLYVAYGAQVLGDVFFDAVLSALVGAAAMTPVAVVVARQRTGPPALVSFLPAFWLLVPGALGLIGVTSMFEGESSGANTIITTIATMVSIALGVLLGLVVSGSARGFRSAPAADWMEETSEGVPR